MKYTAPVSLTLSLALLLTGCGSAGAGRNTVSTDAYGQTETVQQTEAAGGSGSAQDTEITDSAIEEALTTITAGEDGSYTADLFAMDTFMSMKAYGDSAQQTLGEISAMIQTLDTTLSVTDELSDLYAANHAEGAAVTISDTTADILEKALALQKTTDGALEFTSYPLSLAWGFTTGEYQIPGQGTLDALLPLVDDSKITLDGNSLTLPIGAQLDFGAVAKGYAGDRAREMLTGAGISSALLSLGGSTIVALGEKSDGSSWNIAIQDPEDTEAYAGVVSVKDTAVNTSGGYERYFVGDDGETYWHIIDPDTGYPAKSGLISVTVLSDSALTGDGLSTALFVMGKDEAISYWRENGGFEFVLITEDGELYVSQGAESAFTPMGSYENADIHVVRYEEE